MKKIKIPIFVLITSVILFFMPIWKTINYFFPCKDDPMMNTLPCFDYDLYPRLILIGIFIVSLIIIGFRIYKARKKS